jgi:HSP20 family protein
MTLIRWKPSRDLFSLQDEVNRMFENFFEGSTAANTNGGIWSPATDIQETKDDFIVSVELPGMRREDIKVTVQDDALTIRGERKQEHEQKDTSYHRVERSYGFFSRSFTLPAAVKEGQIDAIYQDGILRVTLPKAEEVKPKQIPISVNAGK